jgi:hypothetical protein
MFKKVLVGAVAVVFLGIASPVKASEGVVELNNTVGESSRCFAASILMSDYTYRILMSCRDLVYPVGENVLKYYVYAVPREGKKDVRLGDLGLGKAQFNSRGAFYSLYVVREKAAIGTQKVQQTVIMKGNVSKIKFLDSGVGQEVGPTIAPSPTPEKAQQATGQASKLAETLKIGNWAGKLVGVMLVLGMMGLAVVIILSSWGGRKKGPPEI